MSDETVARAIRYFGLGLYAFLLVSIAAATAWNMWLGHQAQSTVWYEDVISSEPYPPDDNW